MSRGDDVCLGMEYEARTVTNGKELEKLERMHQILETYLWLGTHFEGMFVDMELAQKYRTQIAQDIEESLLEIAAINLLTRDLAI